MLGLASRRRGPEPLADDRLVARVRDGDAAAFEAVYDRYHARILSFCRHMLGSREDGEDATQHVFVSAHRGLLESDKDIQLRPWLFAIARNRCLDMLRARRATDSLDAAPYEPPALEDLPEVVQRREELRALLSDIALLPDDQRAALVLFELGGLSQRTLADVLERRPDQVKALVFQARSSLMADRQARATDCQRVREEIASARGHALLRSQLRRHLRVCPPCREFADETRRQRAALALVLPVLPSAGLKASTLAAAGAGAAGAAAPAAGGGLVSGIGGLVTKGIALKALAVLCVVGAAGGIGYTILHPAAGASPAAAARVKATTSASGAGAAAGSTSAATNGRARVAHGRTAARQRSTPAAARHSHRARHVSSGGSRPLFAVTPARGHRDRHHGSVVGRRPRPASGVSGATIVVSPTSAPTPAGLPAAGSQQTAASSPATHHHSHGHKPAKPPKPATPRPPATRTKPHPQPAPPAAASPSPSSDDDADEQNGGGANHGRSSGDNPGHDGSRPGNADGHTGAPGQAKQHD